MSYKIDSFQELEVENLPKKNKFYTVSTHRDLSYAEILRELKITMQELKEYRIKMKIV